MELRKLLPASVVSILWFLGQCTMADIVHTPADVSANQGLIDLDRDGVLDFGLTSVIEFGQPEGTRYSLSLALPQWSTSAHSGLAHDGDGILIQLAGGEMIGPLLAAPRQWLDLRGDGGVISARNSLPWSDSWATQPIGMLGVQLQREQDLHYGWIRIDLTGNEDHLYYHAKVIDFAYESVPNTPIVAGAVPEPASVVLALIALVGGLFALRVRRKHMSG